MKREPKPGSRSGPHHDAALSDRIVEYLCKREMKEPEIRYQEEYRLARICVALAFKGNPEPLTTATYEMYGVHPATIWQRILDARKAKLGKEFPDWYDQAGNGKPDVPGKKPAVYIPDEQPDLVVNERLAAVLMFPKLEVQRANVEQAGSVRRSKESKGNLYEMPAAARSAEHQPLRILPA